MRRAPRLAALLALASIGCSSAPPKSVYDTEYERCRRYQGTHEICDHLARMKAGPGPASGRDRWIGLEAVAKSNAEGLGPGATVEIKRLHAIGLMVTQEIELEADHCYRIGVAGATSSRAHFTVMFVPGPDGARANDHLAGTSAEIPPEGGQAGFCTDRAGRANVTIVSLGDGGFVMTNARLEYAIAIASAPEPSERRAERRQADAAKAEKDRAAICDNCRTAFTQCASSGGARCMTKLRECQSGYACE